MQSRWLAWVFAATVAVSGCKKSAPPAPPPKLAVGAAFDAKAGDKTVKVTVEKVFRVAADGPNTIIALRVKYDGMKSMDDMLALAFKGPPELKDASGKSYEEQRHGQKYSWAKEMVSGGNVSLPGGGKSEWIDSSLYEVPTDKLAGLVFVLQDREVALGTPEELISAPLALGAPTDVSSGDTKYKITIDKVQKLPEGFAGKVKGGDNVILAVPFLAEYASADEAKKGYTTMKLLLSDGTVIDSGFDGSMEVQMSMMSFSRDEDSKVKKDIEFFEVPAAKLEKAMILAGGKVFSVGTPEAFKFNAIPVGTAQEISTITKKTFKASVQKLFKIPAGVWDPGEGKVGFVVLVNYEFAKDDDKNADMMVTVQLLDALAKDTDRDIMGHPYELNDKVEKLGGATDNALKPVKALFFALPADKIAGQLLQIGEAKFALPDATDLPAL